MSLEVIATCGHPPEIRGQKIRDVHVFTSCPEKSLPLDDKTVATRNPQRLKKPKSNFSKASGVKSRPANPKAKLPKPIKSKTRIKTMAKKEKKSKQTPQLKKKTMSLDVI